MISLSPISSLNEELECFANIECDITSTTNLNMTLSPAATPQLKLYKKTESFTHLADKSPDGAEASGLARPKSNNSLSASAATADANNSSPKNILNKFEKKITEEIVKIFQENNGSFYFSQTFDLTNTIERTEELTSKPAEALWRRADDRFFWNKSLLSDLIEHSDKIVSNDESLNKNEFMNAFILPLIQGFVSFESFQNTLITSNQENTVEYRFCLISRRNRFRSGKIIYNSNDFDKSNINYFKGTRFKRRGIDENGKNVYFKIVFLNVIY